MIDFHTHILPGIDDGSRSFDESIEILKSASLGGVTDIIVSPHFILGSTYNANNEKKKKLLKELEECARKENISINLYLGNEVFVENDMLSLIEQNEISTVNNSRYLLFELPLVNEYRGLKELLFQLRLSGCIPVIAHPERYRYFQKHPEIIEEYILEGALFQCNVGSFYGYYGKEAKELFLLLLKHHMIHFICTDTHHKKDTFYGQVKKMKMDLKKYISEEEIEDLFYGHAKCMLEDKKFEIKEVTPIKKTFFGNWK